MTDLKVELNNFSQDDFDMIYGIGYHYLLRDDEGIVVTYKGFKFVIWKDFRTSTVKIEQLDKQYHDIPDGNLVWHHPDPIEMN